MNEIECLTWASLKRTLESAEGIMIECDTTDCDDYEWWGVRIEIKEAGSVYKCEGKVFGHNGSNFKKVLKNPNAVIRYMKKLEKEWDLLLEDWSIWCPDIDLKDAYAI